MKPKKLSKKEIAEKWKYQEYCDRKGITIKPKKVLFGRIYVNTDWNEGDSEFSVYDIPRKH